jgi:general secretion pathway protein E
VTTGVKPAQAPLLPYAFARRHGVLLQHVQGRTICLHRVHTTSLALAEVQRVTEGELDFQDVPDDIFDARVSVVYRDDAVSASAAAGDAAGDGGGLGSLADTAAVVDDLLDRSGDAPVVRLINALLLEAIRERASDIHIETQEKRLVVRLRIDGILRPVLEPKRALAPLLVSRIKVMARLDIAEKRQPQDGRVSLRVGPHEVDVRVSTIPSQFGERVVLRLLDRDQARLGLDRLGMSARDAEVFARLLARPSGMVLVTGPTGSGKTTTLYAALERLNDRTRNIMTVEDPIEYSLDGIGQVQVNPRTDLSFARGLRAILRQDPDVIMVGEIRDRDTAQIAAEAAMTGHLVLSTLHTTTAIGAVSRLIDLGVERFLLAPMLVGLVAQRLVRRLCPQCRRPEAASPADAALLDGLAVGERVFRATGCPACQGQGYAGRLALYEVIAVTRDLEEMIHGGAAEADLARTARRHGPGLMADGLRNIRDGNTTTEDVARVFQET